MECRRRASGIAAAAAAAKEMDASAALNTAWIVDLIRDPRKVLAVL